MFLNWITSSTEFLWFLSFFTRLVALCQFIRMILSYNKESVYFPDARIGKLDDCFGWRQAFFGGSRSKGKNFLKFMKDWIQRSCFQSWINFRKFLPLLREPPKKACLKPKQSSPTDQNSLREKISSVCWKENIFFEMLGLLCRHPEFLA